MRLDIPMRAHILAVRLEAYADLRHLTVPVGAERDPDPDRGAVHERDREADPEPVQAHVAPKREPDSKWNA